MYCNSFNVICVVICSGCLEEYIGRTGAGKSRLRYRVRVYKQNLKQPEKGKLKVEEYIQICGRGTFKMFPFLQMLSNDTNLRTTYQLKF